MKSNLHKTCRALLAAYKSGKLGQTVMPEDANPGFADTAAGAEMRLAYFTLPMALNYQRDSYKLWQAALKTYNDAETRFVFDVQKVTAASEADVRTALMKYKVALQPNKHVHTWRTIAHTIATEWGTFADFFKAANNDFLVLKECVRVTHKKGFPYLSGPKIFNYWSFIISTYGGVALSHREPHRHRARHAHHTMFCKIRSDYRHRSRDAFQGSDFRTLAHTSRLKRHRPNRHSPSALVLEPEWVFVGGGRLMF